MDEAHRPYDVAGTPHRPAAARWPTALLAGGQAACGPTLTPATGTFNERQGDTALLLRDGSAQASWGRALGEPTTQRLGGDARPEFDGSLSGWQLGHDLLSRRGEGVTFDRAGLMAGTVRGHGDVAGMAGGATDVRVGRLVWQHSSLDGFEDRLSAVCIGDDNAVSVQLGARLHGKEDGPRKPYLKLDLRDALRGSTDAVFGLGDAVATQRNASALELGAASAGSSARRWRCMPGCRPAAPWVATELRSLQGQVGLRLRW